MKAPLQSSPQYCYSSHLYSICQTSGMGDICDSFHPVLYDHAALDCNSTLLCMASVLCVPWFIQLVVSLALYHTRREEEETSGRHKVTEQS